MLSFKMAVVPVLFALLCVLDLARADGVRNMTGTWSSGSQQVLTGAVNGNVRCTLLTQMFYNPIKKLFNVPPVAGVSYSFTPDGYFEMARVKYNSSSEKPQCFKASLMWQHGTYEVHNKTSFTMHPYKGDGAVQIIDPCADGEKQVMMYVLALYVHPLALTQR